MPLHSAVIGAHFHLLVLSYCTDSLQNTSLHCGTLSLRLVEDDSGTAFDLDRHVGKITVDYGRLRSGGVVGMSTL